MSEQHASYRATIPPISEETHRPLWSVMIPTYNCAEYLRETLVSVLAQDPGPEVMQIEVVDDCSTEDDPETVVKELGGGRVSFYQQPKNLGFIGNFETCLKRSRGTLVHLLHGDDYVRDGFYRKMQQAFEQSSEIGAAFCRHIYMRGDGHWDTLSYLEQPSSGIFNNWLQEIATGQRLVTPSVVVRRDVYEKLGGFDRRISCAGEDWEMWVRIAANYPVWYEVEPLAVYRMKREDSLTASAGNNKIIQDMCKATEIIKSYLPNYIPQAAAEELSRKAGNYYAQWALKPIPQMVSTGKLSDAVTQIRQALECRASLGTVGSALFLILKGILQGGKRWLRRIVK